MSQFHVPVNQLEFLQPLVEMQNVTVIWKTIWAVSHKIKHALWPTFPLRDIYPRDENSASHSNLSGNVYSDFIYNCQKPDVPQLVNEYMNLS